MESSHTDYFQQKLSPDSFGATSSLSFQSQESL